MTRKSSPVQAAKPEAVNPAVLAKQLAKTHEQSAIQVKRQKSPNEDELDQAAQAGDDSEVAVLADADDSSGEPGSAIHLAEAAVVASDASPAAAGSVPTGSAAGSGAAGAAAGSAAMGGLGIGLLVGGGLILAASGSGGDADAAAPASNIVSGSIVGGPVVTGNGLTVNLYKADGTSLLGTGVLDENGQFSINVGSYAGVVIAKVVDANTGTDYVDEASGQAVDLMANLMAVGVAGGGTVTLNINPLTTVAALKAGANFAGASTGTPTADAVNQTNTAVAQAFGLSDLTGTTVVTTVSDSGSANSAYNPADGLTNAEKYGAVLAALSGMDSNLGGAQTTIDTLAANLSVTGSTGTLNAAGISDLFAGAAAADSNSAGSLIGSISDVLAQSSASIGINTIAADNAINASESGAGVAITGSNVAGATVALSIGGNTRDATVTGTTWSYTLVADDYTAMGEGGETITATSTLTTGTTTVTTTTATATRSITVDTLAPSLTISSNDAALKSGETATVSFTFSEAPSGFAAGDVTTTGGALSGLAVTSDPKVYTATFTPTPGTASGNASITVASAAYADAAGNSGGAGATPAISIDTLAPTLAITSNVAAVKSGETATITFTFSEVPTAFAAGDVTTTGGTLSGLAVTGDATVYTATFTPTPGTASGNASITVAAGAYTDAAGNNGGVGTTPAISIDTLTPTLTITSNVAAVKIGETATITFTFSEVPTDFAAGDVTTVGGTLSGLAVTGDPKVYTATFTPTPGTASGNASITVVSAAYTDAAGNSGGAGATPAISIDTLAPTITLNAITGDNLINVSEYTNAVVINGTTSGVEDGQIVTVHLNSQTYTAFVSSGAWSVSVPAVDVGGLADHATYPVTADVSDSAGNPATQSSQNVLIASSGPVIGIAAIAGDDFINAAEHGSAVVISGTVSGADGQTLTVHLNGQPYTSTVTNGSWSVSVDGATIGALAEGGYSVTADVSDSTGNPGQQATRTLTVDTLIATPTVALANDNGTSNSDGLTNDASLSLSAVAGDVGRTYAVDGAAASATYTMPTADGSHTVVVTDTDTAGNTANASVTFTLDMTLATPTVALTNDTGASPSDRITSDAGSLSTSNTAVDVTRTFTLDGGVAAVNYTAPIADGSHTVVVTDSDTAGNTATASLTFTRDTTAPTLTVSSVDISADTGSNATDFYTSSAAQTISGTLSNPLSSGDTLYGSVNNGASWTDITAKVSGTAIAWDGATLTAGSDTIGFKVTDSAGNTGATTGAQAYTVDTSAPSFSSGVSAIFADQGTGTVYTAAASDASAVSYSLAGTDAAVFNIDANSGAVTFKTVPSTAAPTDVGADNVYNFNAVATDQAGNSTSQAVAVTVVNAPSLTSTLDNVTNFEVTSNIVLTASENVTAVANKYIHIINDGGTGFHDESTVNTLDILVTDADKVSIVNNIITINPQFDLDFNNDYHIMVDAGAFLGVASGLASVATADALAINFGTVNPSASATAVASQAMNSGTDAMVAGHDWWDAEGNGAPGGAIVARDFGEGNKAIAANDLLSIPGMHTNDFYIAVNNFGVGDLIYVDNHGDNSLEGQADFNAGEVLDVFGVAPTQIITFPSTTATGQNGGQFDVTLEGSTSSFVDTIALQMLLQISYEPILYG